VANVVDAFLAHAGNDAAGLQRHLDSQAGKELDPTLVELANAELEALLALRARARADAG
jgi:hypothetical protein